MTVSSTLVRSDPAQFVAAGVVAEPGKGSDMVDATCIIEGCDKGARGHGWCSMHYTRWRRYGNPLADVTRAVPAAERFWPKVDVGHPLGCWLWTASLKPDYGAFWDGTRLVVAHRWAYEYLTGPIPVGLVLDHLCRNRACVNPDHLEPVTVGENLARGYGPSAQHARQTHCRRGHVFDAENTYRRFNGGRQCRACGRIDAMAAWRARQAAA